MNWTLIQGVWYADDGSINNGTPQGLPTNDPKTNRPWAEQGRYDDGIVVETPPNGYTKMTRFGQSIWLKDSQGLIDNEAVALDHLIEGAHSQNHSNWHRSTDIVGATSSDYYLHPGKNDNTLYLLDQNAGNIKTHTDGLPMIEIIKQGRVNDGSHKF